MPAERVPMRQAREIIRLKFSAGMATREIARRLGPCAFDGSGDVEPAGGRRAFLAAAGRNERRRTGGGALRQPQEQAGTSPPRRAGLAGGASGAEAQARHAADRLGRIYRRQPGRLQLFAVLRTLSRVRIEAVADDAADPRGRRAAVRRLCGRWRAGRDRPADRRNPERANLRRRAGRVELHFRACELDAGASRLDRRPCPRPGGDRRRSAFARAGQHQDRRHQGLPLRSPGQPDLCRDGGALRRRHSAGPAEAPARQSESRAGGADRRAMASRAAAPPHLLQPWRTSTRRSPN